jgi:hypothetical protein
MKIRRDFVSNSSSTSFIMIVEKGLSREGFIKKLGARKGTYAEIIVGQVYDSLKNNSDDFKQDYEKYHKKEYLSFAEYLKKNKNFKAETIDRVQKAYESGKAVFIGKLDSVGHTPMESYLCIEDFEIDENDIFIDGLDDVW